jgi:hypothetical protein
MGIKVIGTPDLVEGFGNVVRSVYGSLGPNWPFSTIHLSRERVASDNHYTPTLQIVVHGSPVHPLPTIPWGGRFRYENDWSIGVPIFDVNAEPIAELIESRVLYILIPLSGEKEDNRLMKMILEDAGRIVMSPEAELGTSERLLQKKLPKEIGTTIPEIFSNFCNRDSGTERNSFDSLPRLVCRRYDQVVEQTHRVMLEQKMLRIREGLERLRICAGVQRSFVCGRTLYIESTPIKAEDSEVLRLYWSPLAPSARYAFSGLANWCSVAVFNLLSEGWVFEAFAELARSVGHPSFKGFESNFQSPDLTLIRNDSGVREELVAFKQAALALSGIAQREKALIDIKGYVRRWYVVAQAVALRTMSQFSSVEFRRDEIRLTAENVINRRNGGHRNLGRIIFHMRQSGFSLDIHYDTRVESCQGEAYYNYQRAVAEGRLVACAEILWQHVTVG